MAKSFYIAGVKFRPRNEIDRALRELKVGDILTMSPEPTNKFDPNAIQIIFNSGIESDSPDIFLGYVPKKFTSDVSADLEIGVNLECQVESVNPKSPTYEMFKVIIKERNEEIEEEEN